MKSTKDNSYCTYSMGQFILEKIKNPDQRQLIHMKDFISIEIRILFKD